MSIELALKKLGVQTIDMQQKSPSQFLVSLPASEAVGSLTMRCEPGGERRGCSRRASRLSRRSLGEEGWPPSLELGSQPS